MEHDGPTSRYLYHETHFKPERLHCALIMIATKFLPSGAVRWTTVDIKFRKQNDLHSSTIAELTERLSPVDSDSMSPPASRAVDAHFRISRGSIPAL